MGGRKEMTISEPTYARARIMKSGKHIAYPLDSISGKFHGQIRIGNSIFFADVGIPATAVLLV